MVEFTKKVILLHRKKILQREFSVVLWRRRFCRLHNPELPVNLVLIPVTTKLCVINENAFLRFTQRQILS